MGLEGIVAERRDSRYRPGRTAFERAMLIALSKRTVQDHGTQDAARASAKAGRQ
jgi:hypothetical protein